MKWKRNGPIYSLFPSLKDTLKEFILFTVIEGEPATGVGGGETCQCLDKLTRPLRPRESERVSTSDRGLEGILSYFSCLFLDRGSKGREFSFRTFDRRCAGELRMPARESLQTAEGLGGGKIIIIIHYN